MWLECKLGRLDYSLLPKPPSSTSLKLTLHLLSLKSD
jgi:hypothetical protein